MLSSIGSIGSLGGFDVSALTDKLQTKIDGLDTNDDGAIQFSEAQAAAESPGRVEHLFTKLDTDHDGVISEAEQKAGIERFTEKVREFTAQSGLDLTQLLLQRLGGDGQNEPRSNSHFALAAYQNNVI